MNVMHKQIINLFTDYQKTMTDGLWFDGYEKEGKYKEWYIGGQLRLQFYWKDGKEDGEYKLWHYHTNLYISLLLYNLKAIDHYSLFFEDY